MLSDVHFLAVAEIVADASTCSRLHVGAVLVYARRIISTGYNGSPSGMPHCRHDPEGTIQGPCTKAVHAEVNAIAFAAKNGVSTDGSYLYTTDSPCINCAALIINAGIKEVKYGRKYRDSSGLELLERAGVLTEELGEPELQLVSVTRGDQSSLYTSKHTDPSFEEGWQAAADSRRGRGPGS